MASSSNPESEPDFDSAIGEVEQQLAALKARYHQVEADKQQKQLLENRRDEIEQTSSHGKSPRLQAELKEIEKQLAEIEHNLESQLFSIDKPFWQAVRFLGLGIVLGWFLKSWSG